MKITALLRIAKQRKGFSLVEVLIALVILAIALFALGGVVVSTTMLMAHTIDKEKAVNLGVEKLETLEADYGEIDDGSDSFGNGKFNRTWTVDSETGGENITMIVQWDGILGSREITLERFVANPEPN